MKRITISILLIAVVLTIASCQPTPAEPVVVSKNDGSMYFAIYGEPAPLGQYDAPQEWKESIDMKKCSDKLLKVSVDAELTVSEALAYPVYRVSPCDISADDAKAFIKAVTGSEKLYDVDTWRTKDVIREEIFETEAYLERQNILSPDDKDYNPAYKESLEKKLTDLKSEYKSAPSQPSKTEIEAEFVQNQAAKNAGVDLYEIQGFCKDSDAAVYISKDKLSDYGNAMHMNKFYRRTYDSTFHDLNMPSFGDSISLVYSNLNNITIKYDDAKKQADNAIKSILGLENFSLCMSGSREYFPKDISASEFYLSGKTKRDKPQRYLFIYTETVDNIPVLYYGLDTFTVSINALSPAWGQHFAAVEVDDDGVLSIWESSTMTLDEKLSKNVPLKPFSEVQRIFRTYAPISLLHNTEYTEYDDDNPKSVDVTIDDIRLGYIKIKEKDEIPTQGLLIPVWIFYGKQINTYESQNNTILEIDKNNRLLITKDLGNPYLCINAVDGSIIDLTQGY